MLHGDCHLAVRFFGRYGNILRLRWLLVSRENDFVSSGASGGRSAMGFMLEEMAIWVLVVVEVVEAQCLPS